MRYTTLLTVAEAVRHVRRDPETVGRWIRTRKPPFHKVGAKYVIEERDLARIAGGGEAEMLPSSFDALVGAPARCVAS